MLTENVPKCSDIFICELCDYKCYKQSIMNKHINTRKHKMLTHGPINVPNYYNGFSCDICSYMGGNKSDIYNHCLTAKHIMLKNANGSNHSNISNKNSSNIIGSIYTCICGKIYKHKSSFCRHKQKCVNEPIIAQNCNKPYVPTHEPVEQDYKELVFTIMKQQELLLEQNKTMQDQQKTMQSIVPNIGSNNNNINNQKFNINMFLNEQCKNAMSLEDLTNSIEITHADLCNAPIRGLLRNSQMLIIDKLKNMDQTERPIHCTDVKRQTLYVKDANGWGKEEACEKIKNSISKIADDHMSYFSKNYPEPQTIEEKMKHHSIICEVSQNVEDNDKAMDKSVRHIAGQVFLDL